MPHIPATAGLLQIGRCHLKRTTKDALTLMIKAEERAGKVPELVFTDKLQAYTDGIELAWGAETKHIPSKGFQAPMKTAEFGSSRFTPTCVGNTILSSFI